jgi:hypothetical protein
MTTFQALALGLAVVVAAGIVYRLWVTTMSVDPRVNGEIGSYEGASFFDPPLDELTFGDLPETAEERFSRISQLSQNLEKALNDAVEDDGLRLYEVLGVLDVIKHGVVSRSYEPDSEQEEQS